MQGLSFLLCTDLNFFSFTKIIINNPFVVRLSLRAVDRVQESLRRGQLAVARVWRAIASDEARHGLLAWRTIEWALTSPAEKDSEALRAALARQVETEASERVNWLHDFAVRELVQPLFACVVDNESGKRSADAQLALAAARDAQLTDALSALEIEQFTVANVAKEMLRAIECA